MRFRLGLTIGFAIGYYAGAKAGRQRYEQLRRLLDKARGSDTYETVTERARTVLDQGVDRARGFVEEQRSGNGDQPRVVGGPLTDI